MGLFDILEVIGTNIVEKGVEQYVDKYDNLRPKEIMDLLRRRQSSIPRVEALAIRKVVKAKRYRFSSAEIATISRMLRDYWGIDFEDDAPCKI